MQEQPAGIYALITAPCNDVTGAIYLSASLDTAKQFADFRARYERASYNHIVRWGHGVERIKLAHTVNPTAKPVVISVNVPDSWKPYIKPDEQTPAQAQAYWTDKPIPPKYITSFDKIPIDYRGKLWKD
jgi:hypothetical protein